MSDFIHCLASSGKLRKLKKSVSYFGFLEYAIIAARFLGDGFDVYIETENKDGKFLIEELDNVSDEKVFDERAFASLELKEKIDIVAESVKSKGSQNIDQIKNLSAYAQIEEAYSPAFSINTSTNKTCKLYNAQGQGSLPICWAASVATIVNYRKGTSITAKNVCEKMNTGYVGAGIDTKKSALAKYGLSYKKTASQLSYSSIKTNINNKYPIAASTFDSNGSGHAVTVYGWNMPKVTDYIIIWNSGTSSTQTMYYNPNGSTYTYNNKTWTWTKSLSYY